MPNWNLLIQRVLELMKRYPGLIAAFGFCSGVGSFILVDRQQGMARWIAVILLVSWVWLMLENSFTQLFSRVFKREIPPPLLRYATQMIHQESLFFVLPFFFITTTWNSGQLVFTGLLGVCALITITDPLYYKWLAPRRWLFLAMHTLALFAAMLTSADHPQPHHLRELQAGAGHCCAAFNPQPGREPAAQDLARLAGAAADCPGPGRHRLAAALLGAACHAVDDRSGGHHTTARPHAGREH